MRTRSIGLAVVVLGIAACSESPTGVLSKTDVAGFDAGGNAGAIWTTRSSCGTPDQDINHFDVADPIYINGSGFDAGTYAWAITGKPGGASTDPGVDVASGEVTPDGDGNFCFLAYTVHGDDAGEYQVKVGNKGDNYRVEGAAFLEVTKTAATSYKRTYHWTIDKSADQSTLTLAAGESAVVNYGVVVDVSGYTDSDWKVTGSITVLSTGSEPANVTGVTDVLSDALGEAAVTCDGVTFPVTLDPGEQITCTYEKALEANPGAGTNTATATIDEGPVTVFNSDAVPFDFAAATVTDVDASVAVDDDLFGALGTAALADAPKTFSYPMTVGPFETCGPQTVVNTATYTAADTQASASDSWTVEVTVTCAGQCTLTQGYWKTHSVYGPAGPADDTWAAVGGPDAPLFDTGLSWYQGFQTSPAGNTYWILAHQYMAAVLNQANGADVSVIASDLAHAAALLDQYDGNPDAMSAITGAVKQDFVTTADKLAQYNEGLIGPGHCSD